MDVVMGSAVDLNSDQTIYEGKVEKISP